MLAQKSNRDALIIGKNLLNARKKAGKSQQATADAVGLDRAQLSRIENGKAVVRYDFLLRMTTVVGGTVSDFLEGTSSVPMTESPSDVIKIWKLAADASPLPAFLTNESGYIITGNERFFKVTGIEPEYCTMTSILPWISTNGVPTKGQFRAVVPSKSLNDAHLCEISLERVKLKTAKEVIQGILFSNN